MFRKMPFILLAVIAAMALASRYLSLTCQSALYAVSLSIKSIIIFVLPFIVFGLMFKTAVRIAQKATKTIFWILIAVCASSFLALFASYLIGSHMPGVGVSMELTPIRILEPLWSFSLFKWLGNDHAMLLGIALGALCVKFKPVWAEKVSSLLECVVSQILKGILYLIPVFIAGFVVKLSYDQAISYIFRHYSVIFVWITCAVFSYIALLYLAINRFHWGRFLHNIRDMLPAGIAGFGSMSSAASMPLTLLGVEKNAKNKEMSRSIITATVNIHLIGDCFATPIFAFAILNQFGTAEPTWMQYLIFAFYFVLAKFSVAAVPGGGILVMLPILESCLGFNPAMLSLITALYILFDPVITCANVLGNGGFALGMDKVLNRRGR